jgi:isoleucyl-tRNA synthetase
MYKDRMYASAPDSVLRRSGQTLSGMYWMPWFDCWPDLSFTTDEMWAELRKANFVTETSVHLAMWPEAHPEWKNADLGMKFQKLQMCAMKSIKS